MEESILYKRPFKYGFLFRNRQAQVLLKLLEMIRHAIYNKKWKVSKGQRVWIGTCAHLGDVLYAISVVESVRRVHKGEVRLLCGSWCKNLVITLGQEASTDYLDLPWMNRTAKGFRAWRLFIKQLIGLDKKINKGCALIDLFPYPLGYSWLGPLLAFSKFGYRSSGAGVFLTHGEEWRDCATSHLHNSLRLCQAVLGQETIPIIWPLGAAGIIKWDVAVDNLNLGENYIVFQGGAGGTQKLWPISKWVILSKLLKKEGYSLVVVGAGDVDLNFSSALGQQSVAFINLVNQLALGAYFTVLRNARLFIGVDSFGAHAAAAAGCKTITISTGITDPYEWMPPGGKARRVVFPVSCAPCFRISGCDTMDCIQKIDAELVAKTAMESFLQA